MDINKIPAAPIMQTLGLSVLPEPFIDEADANTTYIGYAPIGVAEDEEGWMIIKKVKASNVTKTLYAGGKMEFAFAWSDRTSYDYSR